MRSKYFLSLIGFVSLSGCTPSTLFTPYRLEVLQGNYITADQVTHLKVGMARAEVDFLLGTPLLMAADRWDYVYRASRGKRLEQEKRLTVYFEHDRLTKWEGQTFPAAAL